MSFAKVLVVFLVATIFEADTGGMDGYWGTWSQWKECARRTFVTGFQVWGQKGTAVIGKDDTALHGVYFCCNNNGGCLLPDYYNNPSEPQWTSDFMRCPGHWWAYGIGMKSEKAFRGDNTATNGLELLCRSPFNPDYKGSLAPPTWRWYNEQHFTWCSHPYFMCGVKTRVEHRAYDISAFNGIRISCCRLEGSRLGKENEGIPIYAEPQYGTTLP